MYEKTHQFGHRGSRIETSRELGRFNEGVDGQDGVLGFGEVAANPHLVWFPRGLGLNGYDQRRRLERAPEDTGNF